MHDIYYLYRLTSLGRVAKLQRPIADYFRHDLYVPPSGIWSQAYLQQVLALPGPERLLFSTDYPYQYKPGQPGRRFLEEAGLSADHQALFAHAAGGGLRRQLRGKGQWLALLLYRL